MRFGRTAAAIVLACGFGMPAAPAACAEPTFEIVGLDGQSRTIGIAELEQLEPKELTVPDPHTKEPARYRGVELTKVLSLAGVPFDRPLRGPLLVAQVRVEAADGYRVGFSLPELDPRTGSTEVRLAYRLGGEPLGPELGPFRLVVPTDRRGARWVRQLTRLTVTP